MPKVSVIIPNYNHAQYLEKRIQSILDQTYQDFEIIYLDDASPDNSHEVFAKFIDNPRIHAIYNETNSGSPFKQWNKGIRIAKGEYIWIAESDDYADKELLTTLVAKLDNYPNVGVAYCESQIVDSHNNPICIGKDWLGYERERWQQDFINQGQDECANHLVFENTILNASAVLFRRKIYAEIGGADGSMRLCGDWLFWIKMLLISDVAFIAKPLNYFRYHSGTVRKKTSVNGMEIMEAYQILHYISKRINYSEEVSEKVCTALINKWWKIAFSSDGEIPLIRNYEIYKIASQVDLKFHQRLVRKALAILRLRLQLIPPIGALVRTCKQVLQPTQSISNTLPPRN